MANIEHRRMYGADKLAELSSDPRADLADFICRAFDAENEVIRLRQQLAGVVGALERLANPTHKPRTEEAALVQIEVVGIAQAALDALGGQ